jgi:hypothetical protein
MSAPPLVPAINNVNDLMHTISLEESRVRTQLVELDAALEILNTPAWTAAAFELDATLQGDLAKHCRLDRCALELRRHLFLGQKPITGREFKGYYRFDTNPEDCLHDSPFWVAATQVRQETVICLGVHQGRMMDRYNLDAKVVLANPGRLQNLRSPGAPNQVHLAYSLVCLLYATFEIPVPMPKASPLFGAHTVHNEYDVKQIWSAFACLSPSTTRHTKDKYGLRHNLRTNAFTIEYVSWDPDQYEEYHRYTWEPKPLMPWADILCELVGYTRYAEALVPDRPPVSVLTEMRDYCTHNRTRLQARLDTLKRDKQLAIFDMAERPKEPPAEPHTAPEAQTAPLRLLRWCMFSVINT